MRTPKPKPSKCDACGHETNDLMATVEWVGGYGWKLLFWCSDVAACQTRQGWDAA